MNGTQDTERGSSEELSALGKRGPRGLQRLFPSRPKRGRVRVRGGKQKRSLSPVFLRARKTWSVPASAVISLAPKWGEGKGEGKQTKTWSVPGFPPRPENVVRPGFNGYFPRPDTGRG